MSDPGEFLSWLLRQSGKQIEAGLTLGFCRALEELGPEVRATRLALSLVDPDAELLSMDGQLFVRAAASRARAILSAWVHDLPEALGIRFDLPPRDPATAIKWVQTESGFDLSAARVRAHIARARLIEFEFQVPGTSEVSVELEDAVQLFVEHALGDAAYEQWVGAISVVPMARSTRSLLILGDGSPKQHFPILEVPALLAAARDAFGPARLLPTPASDPWFALELPNSDTGDGLPGTGRRFASTCVPSALKGALEGLPFSSERFFPDGFELVFLERRRGLPRSVPIAELETVLSRLDSRVRVVGSGFGETLDFLDAIVPCEIALMARLRQDLLNQGFEGSLGFYRSEYRDLVVPIEARSCAD